MAKALLHLSTPITAMAFNNNCSQMAVALADNNIQIFAYTPHDTTKWSKVAELTKHVSRVTGLDWAPNSNRIVTVGSDRNAYVWENIEGTHKWESVLVLLRISRAATQVKWSPFENKFAVGSAARLVTIVHYEESQHCWVSKHIKKPIKSTIACLSWHPNNYLLAVGSSDNTCRVYSTYTKEIEDRPTDASWGKTMPFGKCLVQYNTQGWVTAIGFNNDGMRLAFASHDSVLSIAEASAPEKGHNPTEPIKCYGKNLPFKTLEWSDNNTVIAAGHDSCIFAFKYEISDSITCLGKHLGKTASNDNVSSARTKFISMDLTNTVKREEQLTCHIAPITDLRISDGERCNVKSFATCSSDGKIYLWNWSRLQGDLTEV